MAHIMAVAEWKLFCDEKKSGDDDYAGFHYVEDENGINVAVLKTMTPQISKETRVAIVKNAMVSMDEINENIQMSYRTLSAFDKNDTERRKVFTERVEYWLKCLIGMEMKAVKYGYDVNVYEDVENEN